MPSDAARFIDEMTGIVERIKAESWANVEKASSVISEALLGGHAAYCISEGHIPPLANAYGTNGNPNLFLPYEFLAARFAFSSTVPMRGDVVVFIAQFDTSPFMDDVAARCKTLGAYTILIGTPTDGRVIPNPLPSLRLSQICDLTIDTFTPPREGSLRFEGMPDVEACPTAGITGILLFHAINIEVAERIGKGIEGSSGSARDMVVSRTEGTIDSPQFLRARPSSSSSSSESA